MDTRRDFIKKAGLLSGLMGMNELIPSAVRRALAIEAAPGTTWKDAEHIVLLMQENRSFDHTYGMLRGVRGFNDPRAVKLANGNPVWLQSNAAGETYAPFRLDIKDSKATWMSSLPHSWKNQVNARNDGKYDQWLNVKRNSIKEYSDMPLTMGYYTREDIPFYYALADGFTVCDQHFCSALTGTDPNRLYFWSGTIREKPDENSKAYLWNDDVDYESLHWRTFPELLEQNNISWKFYQNEISIDVGFQPEQDSWLANFGDNPLEFFAQYHVRLHDKHLKYLKDTAAQLEKQIPDLEQRLNNINAGDPEAEEIKKSIHDSKKKLTGIQQQILSSKSKAFQDLSPEEKKLHEKAFVTNRADPDYHDLEKVDYEDQGTARSLMVPKGDLLHQFRADVKSGQLPMISWLAPPEHLSDHPSSAWYGAWYVSEVMDILTQNPEVWKKTIFILTYDENDGYFDHVPPFTAPHPDDPGTGMVSDSIHARTEYITRKQAAERKGFPEPFDRESPIGLGYRVPLVIASPWSRGGYVNSEVFDHTSALQFLETFIQAKTGKTVVETNISDWRRAICGDLTSVFREASHDLLPDLPFIPKLPFLESIYSARFKKLPEDFHALTPDEIHLIRQDLSQSPFMPVQEKGIKPSCALNYELYCDGKLNLSKDAFVIELKAGKEIFGEQSLGSAFNVYRPGNDLQTWAYALRAAEALTPEWKLNSFHNGLYHLEVYGPNGFYRVFMGGADDPLIDVHCHYEKSAASAKRLSGNIELKIRNHSREPYKIIVQDNVYQSKAITKMVRPAVNENILMNLARQYGWYDFSVRIDGNESFEKRYAGRVETGKAGFTDPHMGGVR